MNARDRQFWREFLLLYRSLPAVWKLKSPEYSSRSLKAAGYDKLVLKLREVEPTANRMLVIKKINSFRTNFRRDLRKRDQSTVEKPFKSTLWYFDLLGFLEDYDTEPSQQRSTSSCDSIEAEVVEILNGGEADNKVVFPSMDVLPSVKKCRRLSKAETSATSPHTGRLTPVSLSTPSDSKALAHTWSHQYNELTPGQKILARKLISDVLYYGCMHQLQPKHVNQLQQMMLPVDITTQNEDILEGYHETESEQDDK